MDINDITEEKEMLRAIGTLHTKFMALESQHPNELPDWVSHIHAMQALVGLRILRKEHPELYARFRKVSYAEVDKVTGQAGVGTRWDGAS